MDNLHDLLAKRDNTAPPEIERIKSYVKQKFDAEVSIKVQAKDIIILAPSAALAGTLRLYGVDIAKVCQTDKKLIFKIGS